MSGAANGADNATAELAANLELLAAVEERADLSQRGLAQRMGVALGLTNAYLKRAMGKGLIKVRQAPARRYLYYLTPQGFAEKARLTREYLSDSFHFFRRVRGECDEHFARAAAQGWRQVLVVGVSELAEIATLAAREHDVTLVAVLDPGRNTERFAGMKVVRSLAEAGPFDAIFLADTDAPQASFDALSAQVDAARILTPRMLRVAREAAAEPRRAAS
jgi:DNA-binding MarR family transcriptional regulator